MGITLTVQASLVLLCISAFFIQFILMKYNKKMAGGAFIFLSLAVGALGTILPEISAMSAICALIIMFIGFMVFFDGFVNKR